MTNFEVFCTKKCTKCYGEGVIIHHSWEQYWKELGDYRVTTDQEDMDWFRKHSWVIKSPRDLPAQEVLCPRCGGNGEIKGRVSLTEALSEIGVKWDSND